MNGKLSDTTACVYGDSGRFTLYISRYVRNIKYRYVLHCLNTEFAECF